MQCVCITVFGCCIAVYYYKKFKQMLTRRAIAYSSFCSHVVLSYIHFVVIHCYTVRCSQKSQKSIKFSIPEV